MHLCDGIGWASAVNGKWDDGGVGADDVTRHVDSGGATIKVLLSLNSTLLLQLEHGTRRQSELQD